MSLDIVILSGFLGSGKTTLLSHWLGDAAGAGTGVIINEAGAVDIDGETVISANDATPITRLSSGCLCCTLRGSVVQCVLDLLQAGRRESGAALERIVIEASGLSLPGPIAASLADRELLRLDPRVSIVSVLDCEHGLDRMDECSEVNAQLLVSHRIVLSKQDLVDGHRVDQVRQAALTINPEAVVIDEPDRGAAARRAFEPGRAAGRDDMHVFLRWAGSVPKVAHPNITVCTRSIAPALDWQKLGWWLEDISFQFGERLLRAKFLLRIEGWSHAVLAQSVGHVFGQPATLQIDPPGESWFVFIVRDMEESEIDEILRQLNPEIIPR